MDALPGFAITEVAAYLSAREVAVWGLRVCRRWREGMRSERAFWDALRARRFEEAEASAVVAPPRPTDGCCGGREAYEQRCAEEERAARLLAELLEGDRGGCRAAADPLAARALALGVRAASKRPGAAPWGRLLSRLAVPVLAAEWARVREGGDDDALLVGAVAFSRLLVPSVSHARTARWLDRLAAGVPRGGGLGALCLRVQRLRRAAADPPREADRHLPLWRAAHCGGESRLPRACVLLFLLVGARCGIRLEAVDAPPLFLVRCARTGALADPVRCLTPCPVPGKSRGMDGVRLLVGMHRTLVDEHNRRRRDMHAALAVVSLLELAGPVPDDPPDAPHGQRMRHDAMRRLAAASSKAVAEDFGDEPVAALLQEFLVLDHNLHLFH